MVQPALSVSNSTKTITDNSKIELNKHKVAQNQSLSTKTLVLGCAGSVLAVVALFIFQQSASSISSNNLPLSERNNSVINNNVISDLPFLINNQSVVLPTINECQIIDSVDKPILNTNKQNNAFIDNSSTSSLTCSIQDPAQNLLRNKKSSTENQPKSVEELSHFISEKIGCFFSDFEFLKQAILSKVNPDILTSCGQTLIHLAVQNCDSNFIQFLVDHGAKASLENHRGQTPICVASYQSQCGRKKISEMEEILLSHGASQTNHCEM